MMTQFFPGLQQEGRLDPATARVSLYHILVAFIAFGIAALAGVIQGLVRAGMLTLPSGINYYQILTAHGVLMGLVFTTYFIVGFLLSGVAKTTGGLTALERKLAWICWILMTIGTVMGTITILQNNATVLYTFYAPLKASPFFYIAAALIVVGSWFGGYAMFAAYARWCKANKGQRSPLLAFMAVTTMALWQIATLGVAAEVLFQLIPWSLGWVPTIDVVLSRTLFWYFGHPLVYFWLMPAYVVWYVCIPKIIGGKVFSDTLARLSFILFLLFSTPVGFHHQLMEPGISAHWKFIHVILTLTVALPSMMTAFSMFAVFERRGRELGGKALFGWFTKLPWKDVRFVAPFIGMAAFIPGGAGGIINASNQLNAIVHNTIWVTGHFHLTVATTVALTFFGVSYWLIPQLTGRVLTPKVNRIGMFQTGLWTVGMLLMSGAMHHVGLLGAPRRTAFAEYGTSQVPLEWLSYNKIAAVGGYLLFFAAVLMIGIVINLVFFAPKGETAYPIAETADPKEVAPAILERWSIWLTLTVLLLVLAYGYPIYELLVNAPPGSPPIRTW
ncbi:UNVERIFIED_CONTAM: cytochrome c oxidase subunit 1 [Brevibacillus sp. OAP136]